MLFSARATFLWTIRRLRAERLFEFDGYVN